MHQKRRWRHLVAPVFIREGGGLFDGGEVLGGGRRVDMAHLYARGRRRLDVALGCKGEENIRTGTVYTNKEFYSETLK